MSPARHRAVTSSRPWSATRSQPTLALRVYRHHVEPQFPRCRARRLPFPRCRRWSARGSFRAPGAGAFSSTRHFPRSRCWPNTAPNSRPSSRGVMNLRSVPALSRRCRSPRLPGAGSLPSAQSAAGERPQALLTSRRCRRGRCGPVAHPGAGRSRLPFGLSHRSDLADLPAGHRRQRDRPRCWRREPPRSCGREDDATPSVEISDALKWPSCPPCSRKLNPRECRPGPGFQVDGAFNPSTTLVAYSLPGICYVQHDLAKSASKAPLESQLTKS